MAKRFKHNLSNYKLMTGDMGYLLPCQLQEVLPGDSLRMVSSALIRVNPLLAPVMHPVTVRIHHWFVPHRLVWDQWEDFITGGEDGNNTATVPTRAYVGTSNSLDNYLGVGGSAGTFISSLPSRGYFLIANEWYRDQDLVNTYPENGSFPINIAWEKDYLTTARPNPQKGPDITIPLGTQAPIYTQDPAAPQQYSNMNADAAGLMYTGANPIADQQIYTDLTQATAANVNDWRRAFALQRYQEARSRFGSRYSEYLKFLGVNPPDSRLQRPEYLGGGKSTINFSEVLQTADTTSGNVGDLKGHGIAAVRTRPLVRHFNEHGYVHSLISVRPKTMYPDAIPRTFLRQTKEDFWQRELEQIGQQPVYNSEVYGDPTNGQETFGWQDRYAEYKHTLSDVAGEFNDILDFWHMARKFGTPPALNSSFVQCDATKRIHATQDEDSLWMMVNNDCRARRFVRKSGASRIL